MRTVTVEIPVELPVERIRAELGCRVAAVDDRPGTCAVLVELRTDRTDDEVVRTEMQRAVASLAQRALAEGNPDETGRAWH